MENKIGGLVEERYLRVMKTYLPFVVILGLVWYVIKKDLGIDNCRKEIERLHKENNEQKMETISFWRDAYKKSSETYLLIIEQENRRNGDRKTD